MANPATLSVKNAGVWKQPVGLYVKDAGVWKEPVGAWVKTGGVWEQFWPTTDPTKTLDLNFLTMPALDPRITFSRASLATYFAADGLLKYAEHNVLLQSQDFDNVSWTKTASATVTANAATAPDATTTADKLNHTVAGTVVGGGVRQSPILLAQAYCFSVYAKAGTKNWLSLSYSSSRVAANLAYFNLAAGVVGTKGSGWTSIGISSAGNGWYRCWGITTASAVTDINVAEVDANSNCTSAGDIYIWGAQVEYPITATTPSTYLPTTTAAYHAPRFDYDPVTHLAKGLLIEESRINVIWQSQDLTVGAYWALAGATITANNTTAPDGTTTADLVTASATPANVSQNYTNITAGVTYVSSIFAKKGTSDWVYMIGKITGTGAETPKAYFNLAAGTVGTVDTNITSATIQNVGNGWYRCSILRTATAGAEGFAFGPCDANGSDTVTVGRTAYFWGAQGEAAGASFVSSYMPTLSASTTRAADVATMTGTNFSSWYNQSAGTFVAEFDCAQSGIRNILTVDSNNTVEQTLIYRNAAGFGRGDVRVTSASMAAIQTPALLAGVNKLGFSFALNDFAICANGGIIGTDATGFVPTPTLMRLGTETGGTNILNGHLRRIQYWNTAKSDAELQTLTT